jgi:carboxymethylenebutenolidase
MDAKTPSGLRRREILKTVAAAPLATILANPALAEVAAATTSTQTITTEKSGKKVSASLAVPSVVPAPAVVLIHEFWGLNDQIKSMAVELSRLGYLALAVDLYDGQVGSTREQAVEYMNAVDDVQATDTLVSWTNWLRAHGKGTGKAGAIGWCFGGYWSLETGIEAGTDCTVIYYGRCNQTADRLKALEGPVMGHFANKDTFITPEMVDGFEAAMEQADKDLTVYRYDADHAFANPTSARYDEEDARKAWERTTTFLGKNLFAAKG